MTIKLDYQPLAFGLDEASGFTNPQIGRLIGCENFELVFGDEGLRRVNGYEIFDGRAAPSDATLSVIGFTTGTAAIAVGDTVTTGTGSARVIRVDIDTGSWVGGDAAGSLIVTAVTGTFSAAQNLQVSTVTKAVCSSYSTASIDDANYATDIADARDYYRSLISAPTGEGAILGVKVWNGTVYCMRNVVGSATATLWRSSASGWTSVRTGLRPSGSMRAIVANFSGNSAEQAMYVCDGKNRYFKVSQAYAVTFGPAVYATEGTSTTNVTPGLGSKSWTTSESSRSWTNGTEVIAYSPTDASIFCIGTVTSSTGTSVTLDVTSFSGAANASWHICTTSGDDRPYFLAGHKNYLFLAYPKGQLQSTDVGDPMTVGSTADAFGIGDEITDLKGLRGDVLAVFAARGVSLLYGDGSTERPWEMKKHSASAGSLVGAAQEMGGDAVYSSAAGVHTLSGTQAFGDFAYTNIGRAAQNTIRELLTDFKTTCLSRKDAQYRIYGYNKVVTIMTVYGSPSPKNVRFTKIRYLHQPVCADSDMDETGDEIMVFGTDDGYVMRERIGATFNGEDIEAFFRTSYWHAGMPQTKKRWRKLVLDVDTGLSAVSLYFKQDIDFNSPDQSEAYNYSVNPGGGYFDQDYWDQFFWDGEIAAQVHASIDGIGRHISLIVYHTGDTEPYIIRGMHSQYSPLGLQR